MNTAITIKIMREREGAVVFAKKYWSFKDHIHRLQLKGHLPIEGIEWEFGGSLPNMYQLQLPFLLPPEPQSKQM